MVTELGQPEDLEQLLERSRTEPILIFKHSTQCSISTAAYNEFLEFTSGAEEISCGLILVLENRPLSTAIETRLGIRHESPQAIVVENGRPIWNASHWSITAGALRRALRG